MRRQRTGVSRSAVADRRQSSESGSRYRQGRWRSARSGRRDLLLVHRILARHGVEPSRGGVLDAPCGTGRLRPMLERSGLPYVGLDVSEAMLRAQGGDPPERVLCAAVERLPFADDTFDVVVSCRLLHHVHGREDLARFVRELTRVSSRLVVASFWDAASLPAWRQRVGLRRGEGEHGRHAVPKVVLQRLFEDAGAAIVGFHHSFRFVSQQTFLVANKRAPVKHFVPRQAHAHRASVIGDLPVPQALGPEGALGQA